MITARIAARPRLAAIRAAALFDGVSETLLADPVIIVDGTSIVAVDSRVAAPPDAQLIARPAGHRARPRHRVDP